MNFDLSYYFAVFLRRLPIFIIISALVSAAAIATAFLLPSVYQSNSVLLVESPQIPGELAAPTVQAAALEKLQTVENRLMTRANLLDIAQRLKVFRDLGKMTPDEIVQGMRDNTRITKSAGKGEATIMTLQFSAETGQTAAGVVNEYVTLILKEDSAIRTKSAEETVDFFEQQVKTLSAQLDEMSAKILDFQNKNSDALPTTLAFRLTQQGTLQGKIDAAEQSIAQLEDQKKRLIAIFETTGQVSNVAGAAATAEARQLQQLKDQLTASQAVMSADHPKIKLLQAQIAQLEIIVKNQTPLPANATDPAASMLDVQIADLDSRLAIAAQQRDQMLDQMTKLQDTIDRTPANQIALDALNRDYANVQQQYNTAVGRQAQATAGETIEVQSKGEKISVVDAAAVPTDPASPNRVLIAGGGTFFGMLLGIATIVLMELLNRSVRRPADIVRAFGITPIVSIPYMRTPGETMRRRSVFAGCLLVAVAGIPAILYGVHVFYQPLDILLERAVATIGIRI